MTNTEPGESAEHLVQLAFDLSTEFGKDEYNKRIAPILRKHLTPLRAQLQERAALKEDSK